MPSANGLTGQIEPLQDEADSILITCASYEDRSTAVALRLSDKYRAEHTVIFKSKEYAEKGTTPQNSQILYDKLNTLCQRAPYLIEFCLEHSIPPLAEFEKYCKQLQSDSSIRSLTIDITTFPRQELLMLLRVLDSLAVRPRSRLLYTEPKEYGTETFGGWLTRGVRSVRTIPGFGGVQPPSKKNLLIMFLGHEEERAAITWKRHQPKKTVLIVPDPSYRGELDGIVEKTHQPLFAKLSPTEFYPPISARGIDEAERAILDLWEKYHESYFLVVAPFGTKLQTLGIYNAVKQKRDIQITYAVPAIYNYNNFSAGVGPIWEVPWT